MILLSFISTAACTGKSVYKPQEMNVLFCGYFFAPACKLWAVNQSELVEKDSSASSSEVEKKTIDFKEIRATKSAPGNWSLVVVVRFL